MACDPEISVKKLEPPLRAGVIDIGSNAIRLLIGSIDAKGEIKRIIKKRAAIRLGEDVFSQNVISNEHIDRVIAAMSQFARDSKEAQVDQIQAVATSAVREAHNKEDFVSRIFKETGINIDIIDGHQESKSILAAVHNTLQQSTLKKENQNLLIMDIGGGSVEFILGSNKVMVAFLSLPLGAVRMLKDIKKTKETQLRDQLNLQYEPSLERIKKFLRKAPKDITLVGTGGNLECLGYLRKEVFQKTSHNKIKSHELDNLVETLFHLNSEQRMERFNFKKDRNDVILPASLLTQKVVKLTNQKKVLLPGVGLCEGLLVSLARK